jgi:hypothetical protein
MEDVSKTYIIHGSNYVILEKMKLYKL